MPNLPALETSNVTLILLGVCGWVRVVLIATCSVPIPILSTIVFMRSSSGAVMTSMVMNKSSRVRG